MIQPPSSAATMWRSGLFWRLLRAMAVVFLTMALTVGLSLWFSNESITQTVAEHDALNNANILSYLSANIDSAYRTLNLLSTNEYNSRFYDIQRDTLDTARRNVQILDRSKLASEERVQLDDLLKSYDSLIPQLFALNGIARTDLVETRKTWENTYERQTDDLRRTAHNLAERISLSSGQRVQAVQSRQQLNQWSIVALAVGGLLLGLLLTILVLRRIVGRISGINADLARLADGDLIPPTRLTLRAVGPTPLNDEIIGLEQSYLKTIRRLAAPLHQIQQDANRISSASAEITEAANVQANNATEGVTAITEVTVTVEELNQTAMQIADAAASVAAAAEQALLSAGHGQEAVRDSIIGMAMIRSRVNDITSRILALSAQSQRISEIIDLIDTMAGQTHILALNAAVESAGAGGEVGERFGVVASEVKKLAQRSAAATREVRAVIAQVQAATNAAVMATEDGLKETEKGVGLAHQSGDANEDIIGMVERTAQLANAISLATQQQRTASEQVVATMREIAGGTRLAASGSRQAARAAGDLSDIAGDLRAASSGFHLPDNRDNPPPPDPSGDDTRVLLLQPGESAL